MQHLLYFAQSQQSRKSMPKGEQLPMNNGFIFTALILSIILPLILKYAQRPAREQGQYRLIAYSAPMKIIAILAILACWFLIFLANRAPENERTVAIVCCGGIGLFLLLMPLEVFFRQILFNDEEIILKSLWQPARRISWEQVASFQHLPRKKEWLLIDTNGRKFQPSYFLQGVQDLYEEAERKGKVS